MNDSQIPKNPSKKLKLRKPDKTAEEPTTTFNLNSSGFLMNQTGKVSVKNENDISSPKIH